MPAPETAQAPTLILHYNRESVQFSDVRRKADALWFNLSTARLNRPYKDNGYILKNQLPGSGISPVHPVCSGRRVQDTGRTGREKGVCGCRTPSFVFRSIVFDLLFPSFLPFLSFLSSPLLSSLPFFSSALSPSGLCFRGRFILSILSLFFLTHTLSFSLSPFPFSPLSLLSLSLSLSPPPSAMPRGRF